MIPLLSPRARAALAVVAEIALRQHVGPVKAASVANALGETPRRFEILLQRLVAAEVLESVRGQSGGYNLAREAYKTPLLPIIEIAESIVFGAPEPTARSALMRDAVDPVLADAAKGFRRELTRLTVADLVRAHDAARLAANPREAAE